MIENVKISKAAFSDLESVLELQKMAFLPEARFIISSQDQSLNSMKTDFENSLFLKAECKNEIIGCVKAREKGEFCWIEKLIVAPQFQKMGIGTSLLTEIEKAFPKTRLYLLCTGTRSSENLDFYESLGYKKKEAGHHKFLLIKMKRENLKS